jgi:hypothetical protein
MPLPGVAMIPKCAECPAVCLPADEERWSAYLTDDEPPELVFYCPRWNRFGPPSASYQAKGLAGLLVTMAV